jgi:hypothetical protein
MDSNATEGIRMLEIQLANNGTKPPDMMLVRISAKGSGLIRSYPEACVGIASRQPSNASNPLMS